MNEARHTPIRAMHGIASQVPTTGSMTTARTDQSVVGIVDALHYLAGEVFQRVATGTADARYLDLLDALDHQQLGAAAGSAVAALELFQEQPRGLEDLEERLLLLNAAELNRPSAATRQIDDCARSIATERLAELRGALGQAFESQPGGIAAVIEQCRVRIKELVALQEHPKKLGTFGKTVDRLRELPEHEERLTAQAYTAVRTALIQAARTAFDEALHELAARKASAALASERGQLEGVLSTFESRGVAFNDKSRAVTDALREEGRKVRSHQDALAFSLTIRLDGPDQDQVLTGCRTKTRCPDLPSLVSKLTGEFEVKLREHAVASHSYLDGANASLAALITDLPAAELIDVFTRTVTNTISDEHTLYRAIALAGVERCAMRLWQRAALTCFTAAVNDGNFGIAPVEYTMVDLPPATNPADQETAQALRDAFARCAPRCYFTDSPCSDEILVTRVGSGFVIGLEDATAALLQRYVESAEIGHAPHLVRFFPESPCGEIVPQARHLAGHLRPRAERDSDANSEQ